VEALHVNATGQMVSKGQPLFEVYSPELVSAQREQELAVRGLAELKDADEEARTGMQRLAAASAARLRNWNIAPGDIVGAPDSERPHVVLRAPVSGVVLEKKAVAGMRFMPGDTLYQLADLSSVWVIADVPEQNIGALRLGSHARVSVEAYPGKVFIGQVDFIYPTLDSTTRTVPVRLALPNPNGLLKPAMFAQVELAAGGKTPVLAVPTSAVIDSGSRQTVLVQIIEGRYEPRAVRLGARGGDYVEVLDGVAEGERVVTSANFLIDAESNLKAALEGFGEHTAHGGKAPTTEHEGH
jgi:multidrug efflux pump subunit AcrA (membrane-fusion protein)